MHRIPPDTCPLCRRRALLFEGDTLRCAACLSIAQLDQSTRKCRYTHIRVDSSSHPGQLLYRWLTRKEVFELTARKPLLLDILGGTAIGLFVIFVVLSGLGISLLLPNPASHLQAASRLKNSSSPRPENSSISYTRSVIQPTLMTTAVNDPQLASGNLVGAPITGEPIPTPTSPIVETLAVVITSESYTPFTDTPIPSPISLDRITLTPTTASFSSDSPTPGPVGVPTLVGSDTRFAVSLSTRVRDAESMAAFDADALPWPVFQRGRSILIEYLVKNTGNQTLYGLVVNDESLSIPVCDGLTLQPDQSIQCDRSMMVEDGQHQFTGRVLALNPVGEGQITAIDSVTYQGVVPTAIPFPTNLPALTEASPTNTPVSVLDTATPLPLPTPTMMPTPTSTQTASPTPTMLVPPSPTAHAIDTPTSAPGLPTATPIIATATLTPVNVAISVHVTTIVHAPLANWSVTLANLRNDAVLTSTSDISGTVVYLVPAGNFKICVIPHAGWVNVYPGSDCYWQSIGPGGNVDLWYLYLRPTGTMVHR